ncbi:50S ribosomal protein L3 [Patescibacteria group bacterium]|nr:50S ribosomal protein L3 [Patescibacteria group bacterium]
MIFAKYLFMYLAFFLLMKKTIKAKKLNMSQIFDVEGRVIPITWLEVLQTDIILEKDSLISITGVSKGKGFQGVMKRHHFRGSPPTHGQSGYLRHGGSIGSETHVSKVIKGKKMPGRMGGETVTLKKLKILEKSDNKIAVKGPIPGSFNSLIKIFVN